MPEPVTGDRVNPPAAMPSLEHDAADLRDQLIDAAYRLIHERGLSALTTREIAKAAGCSDGALYTHFPTKSDLLFAVCQERLPDIRARVGDLIARVGSGVVERNIEAIIRAAQHFYAELVPISAAIASDYDLLMRHRRMFESRDTGPRHTIDAVAAYIAAEQRIGRVEPRISPHVFASMLLGPCYAAANIERVLAEPAFGLESEQFARALAHALWVGMAPKRRRAA